MSELLFLDALYRAGAAEWFDVVAAKPYGFWHPVDAPPDAGQTNFARVALLRQVMERHGDGHKPIWAVEYGWNALPDGWQGEPSRWGAATEAEQAQFAIAAIRMARHDWPWLGLLTWSAYWPAAPPTDARWGFALTTPDGQPRPVLDAFRQFAAELPVATVGHVAPDHPAIAYEGGWRVTPDGADPQQRGDTLRLRFAGTRLDLHLRRMPFHAVLYATVDGQPANALPRAADGRAYVMLYDPRFRTDTVTVAAGLSDGPHELALTVAGGWGHWPVAGFTVAREGPASSLGLLLYIGGALTLLGVGLLAASRRADWHALHTPMQPLARLWAQMPDAATSALAALLGLGFVLSPALPLDAVCLAGLAVLLLARPALGPPLVAAYLPFFLLPKSLLGRSFSVIELGLLLTLVAAVLRTLWRWLTEGTTLRLRRLPLDAPVALFVIASIIATLMAENQGVARHELRLVLVEGVLFYVVVSRVVRSPWPLLHGWMLGAVAVSLFALYQALVLQDVAWAEGVGRVRAFYGSANNLALYLDRPLPVLLALAALGAGRRRWLYGLAAMPVALACFLTFSRGAWLVGIPAALLFLGLVRGRRSLLMALGGLVAIAVALLPVLGTERFARLLDTRGGTTFFRLRLWQGTLNMLRNHPLFGVGPDNFLYAYRNRYVLPDAWEEINLSHPHNLLLDLWTRLGLLGLLAGLWLLAAAARLGWQLYRRLPEGNTRALTLGLLASLVVTVTHGLIDNSIFLVDLMFVFMMTLGLLTVLHCQGAEEV